MPPDYRRQYRSELETLGLIRSNTLKPLPINSRGRMDAMANIPLADHPGKRFVYHAGYSILGAVLEAAAGQDMEQFFQEQMFGPWGWWTQASTFLKTRWIDFRPVMTCIAREARQSYGFRISPAAARNIPAPRPISV